MNVIFMPMYRVSVSYIVTVGRRWSILDKMLLTELAGRGSSVKELAAAADLPDRIVVESLINLLRSNLIEVRTGATGAVFATTAVGSRRAADGQLRPELRRETRTVSLCMDRLTGCWLRSDELDLVPSHDLPEDAYTVTPVLTRLNYDDPNVRGLVYLRPDEDLEGFEPTSRQTSNTYARIGVAHESVVAGLPYTAPMRLLTAIIEASAQRAADYRDPEDEPSSEPIDPRLPKDTITDDDVIVGGAQHLEAIRESLLFAKTHVIIHSCFVNPQTIRHLLPDFERAARRRVKVDCLWGLRNDPEEPEKSKPINETFSLFDNLSSSVKRLVSFSRLSSNSHAKLIIYDDSRTNKWTSIVGSCNFLSSDFDTLEISVRTRSQRIVIQLLAQLIAMQLPASGTWSHTARRLNETWNRIRKVLDQNVEQGIHSIQIIADSEHYDMVNKARDRAKTDIVVGCDLYGSAAETSVLVPLETAAKSGVETKIYYQRPSRYLEEEGRAPKAGDMLPRGLNLMCVPGLHGKFLVWDDNDVVITSFNWLATVSKNIRSQGAELGLAVSGPGIRSIIERKLSDIPGGESISL